jgi:hypothetical protein
LDVFTDPVVQLAALCPICALAALKPEAALAAISPILALFNPAINPSAALLSFSLRQNAKMSQGAAALGWRTAKLAAGVTYNAGRAAAGHLILRSRINGKFATR